MNLALEMGLNLLAENKRIYFETDDHVSLSSSEQALLLPDHSFLSLSKVPNNLLTIRFTGDSEPNFQVLFKYFYYRSNYRSLGKGNVFYILTIKTDHLSEFRLREPQYAKGTFLAEVRSCTVQLVRP